MKKRKSRLCISNLAILGLQEKELAVSKIVSDRGRESEVLGVLWYM